MHDALQDSTEQIIAKLQDLREFSGPPETFWQQYLDQVSRLALARRSMVLVRPDPDTPWRVTTVSPATGVVGVRGEPPPPEVADLADRAHRWGKGIRGDDGVGGDVGGGDHGSRIAIRAETGDGQPEVVLVLEVDPAPEAELEGSAVSLRMLADLPLSYQQERALHQASGDAIRFAEALEIMVAVNRDRRFVQAAMTLCNELAKRHGCLRVSLGWVRGDYVVQKAMSHMEKFEARTSAVQTLEACMQEAVDQNEEVHWPRLQDQTSITLAHEEASRSGAVEGILSLPLRVDDVVVGAVTAERQEGVFDDDATAGLRLVCDQAARRLSDLQRMDRWFGARLATWFLDALKGLLGVENTLWKLIGLVMIGLFWAMVLGNWPYRIEGSFVLKTDDLVVLPAPFAGYIDEVHFQLGDSVEEGDLLLTLDTRELENEESAILAEISRYTREAEKSESQRALAQMRIARAQEAQARARLEKVRFRLASARILAPMDGLVVEGDLKKLRGAPVRKADILFKIARVENMYAEIDVEERDIHEIRPEMRGETAFVSRPNLTFPIMVSRIEPLAVSKSGQMVFPVRASFEVDAQTWWRPGMSGVAKLDTGERNILWILTHRTVEYLSLFFWW